MNHLNANHAPAYMAPRYIYLTMEAAMHAASCLSALDAKGATVHYRMTPTNDEEYTVTVDATRVDGLIWDLDGDGWDACYTVTRATEKNPHAQALGALGGKALAAKMSPQERSDAASRAGRVGGWPKGRKRGPRAAPAAHAALPATQGDIP